MHKPYRFLIQAITNQKQNNESQIVHIKPINILPAIQPALLKQQTAELADQFSDPDAFVKSLHNLLENYADRTHRPGHIGEPSPLTTSYKVQPPVLRMILKELIPRISIESQLTLALCDKLWNQPILEFRQLSASLLGYIPPTPPDPIIHRVLKWINPQIEIRIINSLLSNGLRRMRKEKPQEVLNLAENWLSDDLIFNNKLGMYTLLHLIHDSDMEDLPALFRLIQPFSTSTHPDLHADLLDILEILAIRSPEETSYFLRQTLYLPNSSDTPWLIRQVLHIFPPENQITLRREIKSLNNNQI